MLGLHVVLRDIDISMMTVWKMTLSMTRSIMTVSLMTPSKIKVSIGTHGIMMLRQKEKKPIKTKC
jgi:hypothetical protein